MSEGRWLRDRAAIVGFGHSAYGNRGQFAQKGTTPLVVEAVTKACQGTSAYQQPDVETALMVFGSSPAPSGGMLLRRAA